MDPSRIFNMDETNVEVRIIYFHQHFKKTIFRLEAKVKESTLREVQRFSSLSQVEVEIISQPAMWLGQMVLWFLPGASSKVSAMLLSHISRTFQRMVSQVLKMLTLLFIIQSFA